MIELVDGMIAELVGSSGEPDLTGFGFNRRGFQSTGRGIGAMHLIPIEAMCLGILG